MDILNKNKDQVDWRYGIIYHINFSIINTTVYKNPSKIYKNKLKTK